ncbi:hypothetical protein KF707_22345 [Candidatus Obscuribacterales bacterium]|nr:hypothetical protein [Candidatus Obscuribacterales bacterium]MBX3138984.1 hypothetical protein [Candidatus Obscuribacterales bacterium]MBX3151539.1 hypothetical protein [Candidatus Obscuribacterales bacterium]
MNQLPPVPALGLTLAIPRDKVQHSIEAAAQKGAKLIKERAASPEIMQALKKQEWEWTLETSNILKQCFTGEAPALHFASNVYFEPSLKMDDFERDCDEFPHVVKGKLDRLVGLHKVLPMIPEPPCGEFMAAQLHPQIYHICWKPFERHHFGEAIVLAVKEVEDAVKMAVSGNINDSGVALVRKAFDPEEGILIDKETSMTDNQGVGDLLAGFLGRYGSVQQNSVFSFVETARILTLASYLLGVMDARKPVKAEEEKPADGGFEFEFLKPD